MLFKEFRGGHEYSVHFVAATSEFIVSREYYEKTIIIWSIETQEKVRILDKHT